MSSFKDSGAVRALRTYCCRTPAKGSHPSVVGIAPFRVCSSASDATNLHGPSLATHIPLLQPALVASWLSCPLSPVTASRQVFLIQEGKRSTALGPCGPLPPSDTRCLPPLLSYPLSPQHPTALCRCISLSVSQSVCLSVRPSVPPSVCPSVCLFIYLFVSLPPLLLRSAHLTVVWGV